MGDDVESADGSERREEAVGDQRVIVDDPDPDAHACQATLTCVPRADPSIDSSASIACARRRIDARPIRLRLAASRAALAGSPEPSSATSISTRSGATAAWIRTDVPPE